MDAARPFNQKDGIPSAKKAEENPTRTLTEIP
jgi:hypothetical protein